MNNHIKKSALLFVACSVICLHVRTIADLDACSANYELSFYCDAKVYGDAKKACEDSDSYLVKIDNANTTEVVDDLIDKANCTYREDIFIGATAAPHPNFPSNGSKRIWTWQDGSKVYLPTEDGYQNWRPDQPNDSGGREDCLILDKRTKLWKDSPCYGPGESKYYICQKKVTIKMKVSLIPNGRQCEASAGVCAVPVEWRRGDLVVRSRNGTVYQTKAVGLSILHYEKATIGDVGEYVCVALVSDDEANPTNVSTELFVNGAPEITDISFFQCNNTLQVLWRPHFRSLGFRHRILVTEVTTEKLMKVTEIRPHAAVPHYTEVSTVKPLTKYYVKVVVCEKITSCSDQYATTKTITTKLGINVAVSNATIQQGINAACNDTCIVTWNWLHNISETFQIFLHLRSSKNSYISTTIPITITGAYIYSFVPISEQVYDVKIRPVIDKNFCAETTKAAGSCVGETSSEINMMIIVIPSAAGFVLLLVASSVVIVLCKRKKSSTSANQTELSMNSRNDYECPVTINPKSNNAAVLNIHDYMNISSPIYDEVKEDTSANHSYENL